MGMRNPDPSVSQTDVQINWALAYLVPLKPNLGATLLHAMR